MSKKNARLEHEPRKNVRAAWTAIFAVGAILVAAIVWGLVVACERLSAVCAEQARITDAASQVVVATGKIIPAKLVTNHFGLTNGANTTEIPFAELRARFLADMPNARDVRISRKTPNGVKVEVIERTPVARIATVRAQGAISRCVDSEGVAFYYPPRDTALLPIIRVSASKTPKYGTAITGFATAALRLAEESTTESFEKLHVQDVDATGKDYLVVTFDGAVRAKIAWADMDVDAPASRESLRRQLTRLQSAMTSKVAEGAKFWNATDYGTPGRVYASDPFAAE